MQKQLTLKQAKPKSQHNPEFTNLVHTGGSVTTASFLLTTGYNKIIKKNSVAAK